MLSLRKVAERAGVSPETAQNVERAQSFYRGSGAHPHHMSYSCAFPLLPNPSERKGTAPEPAAKKTLLAD